MPIADSGSTMSEDMTFEKITPKPLPHKYEAGEPPFSEVEAWGPALDYWTDIGLDRIEAYERELTEYARSLLQSIPSVRILGDPADRISVVSFVAEGKDPGELEQAFDRDGIAVRAGNLEAAPLLRALGVEKAVRASFMFYNTREEAEALARSLGRTLHGPASAKALHAAERAPAAGAAMVKSAVTWKNAAGAAGGVAIAAAGIALARRSRS
jgi:cysteine desulfurase/selenocysteine lyase